MDWESESLCRICLLPNQHVINLINEKNSSISYLGKLQACIPSLNITEFDPFPKNICEKCVPLLDQAFEFHQLCLESDDKLRDQIERIVIKIEPKDGEEEECIGPDGYNNIVEENLLEKIQIKGRRKKSIKTELKSDEPLKKIIKKKSKCFDENGKRIRKKQIPRNECDICGRKVIGLKAMEEHLRVHTGERPYICERCGKAFSAITNYSKHLTSHDPNREKKYQCTICTYRTASHKCMKQHLIMHTGKLYPCDICSQTFNRESSLYNHKRNVHAAATIPCGFCEEKFTTQAKLRQHIVYHFREIQYSCPECKNLYSKNSGVISHMKRKHPGSKWPTGRDNLVQPLKVSPKGINSTPK